MALTGRSVSRVVRVVGAALALLAPTVPGSVGAQPTSAVEGLLAKLGFSARDLRDLRAGSPVIRTLDTPEREQIEHVSAVLLDVSAESFVERFRDIEQFERGPGTPQIGRFSAEPRYADVASLTLPDADIEALRTCRPGDCEVKLSAAAMRRFRRDVDWSSARASGEVNRLARRMILDLVLAYRMSGNEELGSYGDGDQPLLVAEHLAALIRREEPLPIAVPGLRRYLDDYPHGRPAGAEDFIYWTLVNFGLKDTIRVNHVVIQPLPDDGTPVAYVIATKQLYASHYFHTTLELRFLLEGLSEGRTTLVSVTRSRNDGMTGFRGWFLRPIIQRRSRQGVLRYLDHVKAQVKQPAAGKP